MPRQQVDDAQSVAEAAACGNCNAKYNFAVRVMHPRTEDECAALIRTINCPARKAARHFLNVTLRVAAVNAERVQFQQLACIVFVDVTLALRRRLWGWRRLSLCSSRWRRTGSGSRFGV